MSKRSDCQANARSGTTEESALRTQTQCSKARVVPPAQALKEPMRWADLPRPLEERHTGNSLGQVTAAMLPQKLGLSVLPKVGFFSVIGQ